MEEYQMAMKLLAPIWRGIAGDYKRKYARNIWDQFESNIRAAAYTSRVSKFINSICSRLPVVISNEDVPAVNEVLSFADDRLLLKQLRDEAATLVLMVRLENEQRKEEWKRQQEASALDHWRVSIGDIENENG